MIVLNYNTREHLTACFGSLQQIVYPTEKLELILVDNASTDESVAFMRANFVGVKLIINNKNYGFCRGNNLGAEQATGELIVFLNPDMRVESTWLIELVKPLLADPEVASAGSKILSWDGQTVDFAGGLVNFYGYGYQDGFGHNRPQDFNQAKPILFACGGAMLIRRRLFLEAGGFDEDYFAYYEDVDLGWRLWVLGYKVMFAPASVVYHHHHGAWGKVNQEKRRVLYERNAFFTLLKNYDEANLSRILPVALLLLLKRIHLAAGVEEQLFRLGAPSQPLKTALRSTSSSYSASYYLKEAWRTLTTEGLSRLVAKFKAEIRRRRQVRQRAQLPGPMQLDSATPEQALVPLQALSYVVAANDIITLYPKILPKRAWVQARRRRSDQEISQLFGRPFGSSESWPEYQQTQADLTRLFGLEQIF